ncbi:lycopene cyclase family protein [Roseivirga sp. BDSF3-8]|uniref:lycopene cyclase family protein n=1 Tax=Roseivirga sp. BDSF3-8 TaxID=3241598 RepID=UPI0035322088
MNSKSKLYYDFVFSGGGCAGLSLAYRLAKSSLTFSAVIVDSSKKRENDRTWCFWEENNGPFENIIFRSWDHLSFFGTNGKQDLNLHPYRYKMLKGIDFYDYVYEFLKGDDRFSFLHTSIKELRNTDNGAEVLTDAGEISCRYVFNSALRPEFTPNSITYFQHFKGWFIKTSQGAFEPESATLMDFRIKQEPGEARFIYILPFSENEALIEFTVFSPALLPPESYNQALRSYISEYTSIKEPFKITHQEFGSIPMSEMQFDRVEGNIFHIGTAGGMAKASTGYTFTRIQKEADALVRLLEAGKKPIVPPGSKRFRLYDSTLLDVMANERYPAADVFSTLFKKNSPATVLKFLDEDTTILQDIRVMATVPLWPFLSGMLSSLRRYQTFR